MIGREDALGDDGEDAQSQRAGRATARSVFTDDDQRGSDEQASRSADNREQTEDRELSEEMRLEMFRDSLQQSVLPDLPPMPGYHIFWATTNNPRDSVHWRLRIGYELVKYDEVPSWGQFVQRLKTGEFEGCVCINEMIAMRIPLRLYNRYMSEVHHKMPLEEEGKLKSKTEALKQQAQAMGARFGEDDADAGEIVQRAKPMPEFLH